LALFKKQFVIVLLTILGVSLAVGIWFLIKIELPEINRGKVFVIYAGSLVKTFESTLGPIFKKETGYSYFGEGKGSGQIANMILDGQRRPDVFISAGTTPILKLIDHNPALAHWLVKFASAEMVIAYSPNSSFFNNLEKARKGQIPWYEVLSNDSLRFRRTDPELDPKGYYMIITAKLANLHYNDKKIKDKILGEDRNPDQILPEETLNTVLEFGQIDAIAAYKHEAVARGLPYIKLPQEINLSNVTFSNFYRQGSYTLRSGQTIYGEPIFFSQTILETRRDTDASIAFVKFLLSEKGQYILKTNGLNPIKATIEGDFKKIPSVIKSIVEDQNEG
jgi:molybdate/tungstate transport system substrate-binding protein